MLRLTVRAEHWKTGDILKIGPGLCRGHPLGKPEHHIFKYPQEVRLAD